MAHFARVGLNNEVDLVVAVDNINLMTPQGVEQESIGLEYLTHVFGEGITWIQTSYNGTFRKHFAGVGFTYDSARDAFIPPKPYNSWVLDEDTCIWSAPNPYPEDGKPYTWDEPTLSWIEVPIVNE